ncbi:hypothetical protein ACJ72_05590 [Emergomyces africanus]|uniref:Velvet domain-containing protein n=1 Tax=Emergomyces africanus TaxID=1955775 RepID=A0A1B7NU05_9EURO|nr:hypothetical protein ACJ72_05590 [Emergomyces africanus]
MDPAQGRRTSSGMNKSKTCPAYRDVNDTSPVDSTLSHNPSMLYASSPRYEREKVAQSAGLSPPEPLFQPPYSNNPPVSQEYTFQSPPLHSESTPQVIETSPKVLSPGLGAYFSSPIHNGTQPESNREDEPKCFTNHSRTTLPDSILPSAQCAIPLAASVPSGFGHLLHPPSPPPPKTNSNIGSHSRLRLFVRQQPIAARACGFGDRCRRTIDPLPVIQLLMTDFSPLSIEDRGQLTSEQHVVACHLFPSSKADSENPEQRIRPQGNAEHRCQRNEPGTVSDEDGRDLSTRRGKILSGNTYASPFSVDEDPDPAHAPRHPNSTINWEKNPNTTFARPPALSPSPNTPRLIPATFFVFSDLCVRTVGWYQLRFQLIDIQEVVQLGSAPILDEVWSQPFRVFAPKDFPGMRPTPYLTMRLTSLGTVGIRTRENQRGRRKVLQRGSEDVIGPGRD